MVIRYQTRAFREITKMVIHVGFQHDAFMPYGGEFMHSLILYQATLLLPYQNRSQFVVAYYIFVAHWRKRVAFSEDTR